MAPLDELLEDPEYINWVKSGLALNITNEVLRPFVVEEIKKLHQSIVRTLPPGASCGGCRVNTGCQNGICNKIQCEIEKNHWYPNPTFENTCTGRWSTEPWEIAKCYMSPSKRCKRSSASDADFSACINVIINCKHFQNFGTSDPNTTETVYSESRDFRNHLMHESSQKVSKQYMEENLDILINILNKIKTPEPEDDTNEAIEKIQKIKIKKLKIKFEDAMEVTKNAIEANADNLEKDEDQAMASLDSYLKDPEYKNWVKSGLALNITYEVLRPFVVKEITKLHQSIVKTLPPGVACTGCNVNTACPKGICDEIQRKIKNNHWYPNPSFKNTCTGRWSADPWEIAKCYMPPLEGYGRSSAADADFSACISVIIDCKHFQAFGTSDPNITETDCSKSRDFWNRLMYASPQKVIGNDMRKNLDMLINILHMIKTPENKADTKEAIEKIEKIKTNQLKIKLGDVIEVQRTATEALCR